MDEDEDGGDQVRPPLGGQTEYIIPKRRIGSSIVQNPVFCGFVVL